MPVVIVPEHAILLHYTEYSPSVEEHDVLTGVAVGSVNAFGMWRLVQVAKVRHKLVQLQAWMVEFLGETMKI